MKYFIILFSFLLVPLTASAQPDTLWTRRYGSELDEHTSAILTADSGAIVIAGFTGDWPNTPDDFFLTKVNSDGDVLWSRSYGTDSSDVCYAAAETDSGYALVGDTWSNGQADFRLIVVNQDGDSLWSRSYGGEESEVCDAVVHTSDGGYLLAGTIYTLPSRILVIKTDSQGDSLWSYVHAGEGGLGCMASDEIETLDGGYLVLGSADTVIDGDAIGPLFCLIRLDLQGQLSWYHQYLVVGPSGALPFAESKAIASTPDGGYLLTGYFYWERHGELMWWPDAFMIAVDGDGHMLWHVFCGNQWDDRANDVVVTADSYLAVGGRRDEDYDAPPHVFLTLVNQSGIALWNTTIHVDSTDYATSVLRVSDGYVIACESRAFGSNDYDLLLVKVDSTLSMKTSEHGSDIPTKFDLLSYPNPFNPTTTISFSLPKAGEVSLKVYDVTGREVQTLAEQRFDAGEHAMTFDGRALPSGIYFARMAAGTVTQTQKMVLLK